MEIIQRLFAPAPHRELMEEEKIPKKYTFWRLRIMYSIFIGYAVYYFTRGTLAIVMPELKAIGYDEVTLGWIVTIFQITYGVSKFGSGILADQSNPRYFMAIGLLLTGVTNILFGTVASIYVMGLFWAMNGFFQGWGSAPCHRLLTHWYSQKERGRWWGFWNTSHNAGAALLPLLAAFLISNYGWQSGMIVPGIIAIITSLFLMNRLRDTPQSLGLPAIEEYKNDYQGAKTQEIKNERELTTKEILFKYILKNKYIWPLAISYFLIYVVRWSLSQWSYHFFVDQIHLEKWQAAKCLFWFEAGGFVGSLSAGWFSDVLFKGRRGPVNALFALMVIPATYLLWQVVSHGVVGPTQLQGIMGIIGFFIFGPQMLIAVAAAELSHKKASATAVGFLGIIAYIGCSVTGGPLGHIIKNFGWDYYFMILIGCSVLAFLMLSTLWRVKRNLD